MRFSARTATSRLMRRSKLRSYSITSSPDASSISSRAIPSSSWQRPGPPIKELDAFSTNGARHRRWPVRGLC